MAVIRQVQPVRPVCALTWGSDINIEQVLAAVSEFWGATGDRSPVYPFDFTAYYAPEMGENLLKCFVSFDRLMHPQDLAGQKRLSNDLEQRWTEGGNRRVNIDPAYVGLAKLVVASAKDFAHRVYIGEGIYADHQLQYRQGRFHPHPWTFPDYQTELALGFFKKIRDQLADRLKI